MILYVIEEVDDKVSMHHTSLEESFCKGLLLDDAQLILAKVIYFSRSAMMMVVESDHWKKSWKNIVVSLVLQVSHRHYALQTDLLKNGYGQVTERVQRISFTNILLSRCTIVSDGCGPMYKENH